MCTFCPQCDVQYMSGLNLVWFPLIDEVISLVMRTKQFLKDFNAMRSCAL
jgi:hypothetical protein